MSNLTFPVPIQTMEIRGQGVTIYYPQVVDLPSMHAQQKINRTIYELINSLIRIQYEEQGVERFEEMIGTFEIKTNERNVISLTLSNYAYAPYHAHGLTIMRSLTFDVQTGNEYTLQELFQPDSDYVNILSNIVQQQINERHISVINSFTGVSAEQNYYIADQVLVLYFQLYEITPYYVGIPLFPIPIYKLIDIVNEESPLGRMLGN